MLEEETNKKAKISQNEIKSFKEQTCLTKLKFTYKEKAEFEKIDQEIESIENDFKNI
jgi:hypothetical protein